MMLDKYIGVNQYVYKTKKVIKHKHGNLLKNIDESFKKLKDELQNNDTEHDCIYMVTEEGLKDISMVSHKEIYNIQI